MIISIQWKTVLTKFVSGGRILPNVLENPEVSVKSCSAHSDTNASSEDGSLHHAVFEIYIPAISVGGAYRNKSPYSCFG